MTKVIAILGLLLLMGCAHREPVVDADGNLVVIQADQHHVDTPTVDDTGTKDDPAKSNPTPIITALEGHIDSIIGDYVDLKTEIVDRDGNQITSFGDSGGTASDFLPVTLYDKDGEPVEGQLTVLVKDYLKACPSHLKMETIGGYSTDIAMHPRTESEFSFQLAGTYIAQGKKQAECEIAERELRAYVGLK